MDERREAIEQEIRNLECELTSTVSPIGDWKIAKYMEYQAIGEPAPYDINALHAQRQAVRDRINELQAELDALPDEGGNE
ncbi:MAG: hypothetical protein IKP95_12785 [Ruminococcus sp.]|nr:hypothetical protein [Ruminococcus sp.]MBR6103296.1 hypothetical protein [Ruminococcus sp.]